jgi:hypothetical protein
VTVEEVLDLAISARIIAAIRSGRRMSGRPAGSGRHPFAAALSLVAIFTLGIDSATAAAPSTCRIRNTVARNAYGTLQVAIDSANRGDRLTVRGVCVGTSVIDKALVIEGVRDRGSDRPHLDGDARGIVVTVPKGVTATIIDVEITGGRGHFRNGGPEKPYNWPAGVENRGHLTLHVVRLNLGIGIENSGSVRLNGHSLVGRNGYWRGNNTYAAGVHDSGKACLSGSEMSRGFRGVVNEGSVVLNGASRIIDGSVGSSGTLKLNDTSRISSFGYAGVVNSGTMTLNDRSVINGDYRFTADGGVFGVLNSGTLTMTGASRITDNGSGVVNSGNMSLNDSSRIIGNGNGVWNSGTLTLNGSSSIRDNHIVPQCLGSGLSCSREPRGGAGVLNEGSLVLNDSSSISGRAEGSTRSSAAP